VRSGKKIAGRGAALWPFLRQPQDFAVISVLYKNFAKIAFFALAGASAAP
jgi:hypothetical protein